MSEKALLWMCVLMPIDFFSVYKMRRNFGFQWKHDTFLSPAHAPDKTSEGRLIRRVYRNFFRGWKCHHIWPVHKGDSDVQLRPAGLEEVFKQNTFLI